MKKFFLLSAAFLFSIVPASALVLTGEVAESYTKVIDGWTYITNAKEFMLLVSECQNPDVEEKGSVSLRYRISQLSQLYEQR